MLELDEIEIVDDEVHRKFLKEAYDYAWENNHYFHTKTAAIIVKDGKVISCGTNRLPDGVEKKAERLERPLKYKWLTHAERTAFYNAAKSGIKTEGATMYTPWFACTDCAMAIIEGGVKTVVGHKAMIDKTSDRWAEDIGIALGMLREAGVRIILFDGEISSSRALFDGMEWSP